MTIQYIDPQERWSEAIVHNGVVYYTSVPTNLIADAYLQTKSALTEIDNMLARVNSDKTDLTGMNKAWDEWVTKGRAPVRCTVQAALMNENYKVEIKIVAAINL